MNTHHGNLGQARRLQPGERIAATLTFAEAAYLARKLNSERGWGKKLPPSAKARRLCITPEPGGYALTCHLGPDGVF